MERKVKIVISAQVGIQKVVDFRGRRALAAKFLTLKTQIKILFLAEFAENAGKPKHKGF